MHKTLNNGFSNSVDDYLQIFTKKTVSGMIAASCVKSAQTVNKMRSLVAEGITEKDWTEAIVRRTFEEPNPDKPEDTPLTKGEFDIVKALLAKCPEVKVGKILADKMVDLAGEVGTHLR